MNKKIETIKKLQSNLKEKLNVFELKNEKVSKNTDFYLLCRDALCQYNLIEDVKYSKTNLLRIGVDAYRLFKFLEKLPKNDEIKDIENLCEKIFYKTNGFDIGDFEYQPDRLYHFGGNFTQNTIDYLRKNQDERDKQNKREKLDREIKTFYDKIKFSIKYAIFLTMIFTFINYKILNTNSLYEYSTSIFVSLFTGIYVFHYEFEAIILNITWKIKWNFFIAISKTNHFVPSFRRIGYKLFELVNFTNK